MRYTTLLCIATLLPPVTTTSYAQESVAKVHIEQGLDLAARGDTAAALAELRLRELDLKGRDRATEYHSLDLQRAPAGEYEITLKVWDRTGQQLASRERVFTVVRDE